eukprot:4803371-Prymnesium_polylepis.1
MAEAEAMAVEAMGPPARVGADGGDVGAAHGEGVPADGADREATACGPRGHAHRVEAAASGRLE